MILWFDYSIKNYLNLLKINQNRIQSTGESETNKKINLWVKVNFVELIHLKY